MSWYIDNKYSRKYFSLIEHAKSCAPTGYAERHHIRPRSLGGSDHKDNLVALTAKQHFVCHHLLTKMVTGKAANSMIDAFWLMANTRTARITSTVYENLRKAHGKSISIALTGLVRHNVENYKRPKSEDHKRNISLGRIGIVFSPEHCAKLGHAKSKKWIKKEDETKQVFPEELSTWLEDGWQLGRNTWKAGQGRKYQQRNQNLHG